MTDDSVDTRLGRIEGKLDAVLAGFKETDDDHETRIRDLESSKGWLFGVGGGLVAVFSVAKDWLRGG